MTKEELNKIVDEKGVKIKAIDITPYFYSMPCELPGDQFILNEMCCRRWSDNGDKIWWLLDTHNTFSAKPNDLVEVVPTDYHSAGNLERWEAEDAERMAKRPKTKDPSVSPGVR